MDSYNQQYTGEERELSLKDLILLARSYFFEVLKFWWLVGIFTILIGAYFLYKATKASTQYNATVTYTTGESSGISGLAGGLLGRFVGGKGGSQVEKMQAMLSSRQIMKDVLFHRAEIDGKEDFLINHHFKIYNFKDDDGNLVVFNNTALSSKEDRRRFKGVHSQITKILMSTDLDDVTGIATITITSRSEEYSYELSKTLYQKLEAFYIDTEIGEQKKTLAMLEQRADSIYNVLNGKAITIAKLQDKDKGRFLATDLLPEVQTETEFEFLRQMYGEVLRNLETVRFTVNTSKPSIKVVDYPMLPLIPMKESIIKRAIIGCLIGAFVSIFFIVGRKVFIDIMKSDDTSAQTT